MRIALIVLIAAAAIGGAVGGAVWLLEADPAASPPPAATRQAAPAAADKAPAEADRTPAAAAGAPASASAPTPTSAAEPERPAALTASCAEPDLFTVVAAALDRPPELRLLSVDVTACRQGYARVIAIPDNSGCAGGGACFDREQVFLRDFGGRWVILASGTGIDCATDPDLPPELDRACRGLGLRSDPPFPGIWPASWAELADLQAAVDQGHQPWRGDPAQVAASYLASIGLEAAQVGEPTITGQTSATVAYTLDGDTGLVTLGARAPGAIWFVAHHQPAAS